MILYGASGHSLVVKDILEMSGDTVSLYIDDDINKVTYAGVQVQQKLPSVLSPDEALIITIGNNRIRKIIAETYNCTFANAFAPSAYISKSAEIGTGTVIFFNALIQAEVKIGKHTIINNSVSIDHECVIGDYVHIAPGVVLCGAVKVGAGTMIGAGATVIQCINIGKNVTVGAGSVVLTDVPDNATVVGNPARIIKYTNE